MAQLPGIAHPVQQLLGVVGSRRKDDLLGGERAQILPPLRRATSAHRIHDISTDKARRNLRTRVEWSHGGHRGQRVNLRTVAFGEVEIVLVQCVLRTVPAAGHARTTADASPALRTLAAEVRVIDRGAGWSARGAEEDTHGSGMEARADPHVLGDLLHDLVGRSELRVLDHAQHAFGLVVMRRQFGAPVGYMGPLPVLVEGCQRLVQRVGVNQGPTAHTSGRQDDYVVEQADALHAEAAQRWRPQEVADIPGGLRIGRGVEALAGLHHADPVSLLDQAQCADRSTEAGSDHHHVVIVSHVLTRFLSVSTGQAHRHAIAHVRAAPLSDHDVGVEGYPERGPGAGNGGGGGGEAPARAIVDPGERGQLGAPRGPAWRRWSSGCGTWPHRPG